MVGKYKIMYEIDGDGQARKERRGKEMRRRVG